ncbi:MAG: hypothetical protein P8Y70_00470 [Candidatus Lokiarchaeota archaeon]
MNIDEIVINFLKTNFGKAFTLESLSKRIEGKFQSTEQLDYFRKYTQGLLNRLVFNFLIDMEEYNGKNYYFVG